MSSGEIQRIPARSRETRRIAARSGGSRAALDTAPRRHQNEVDNIDQVCFSDVTLVDR